MTEAPIGQWTQGIAFSRDGGTMLVQDMVGKRLQVFRLEWNGADSKGGCGARCRCGGDRNGVALNQRWASRK